MNSLCDNCKNLRTHIKSFDYPDGDYTCIKFEHITLNPYEEVTDCEGFESTESAE